MEVKQISSTAALKSAERRRRRPLSLVKKPRLSV